MTIFILMRALLLVAVTSVCAVTDLRSRRIANRVLGPGALMALTLNICSLISGTHIDHSDLCIVIFLLLILCAAFSLRLIGGGDVKLYALTALIYPGTLTLDIMTLSFFTAGIYALWLLLRRTRKYIPMAVFIWAASVLALTKEVLWKGLWRY